MADRLLVVVHALGVSVTCEFVGAAAAEGMRAAQRAWGDLLSVREQATNPYVSAVIAEEATHPYPAPDTQGGSASLARAGMEQNLTFTVESDASIQNMLDSMSSRVTLAAIEQRSGELLMLHACGLRLPGTDRVVACVAASGTGKTTMSRSAAGVFEYVSDETVGVTEYGAVVRYPKPLSIKQEGAPSRPKTQRNPCDLDLVVAAETDLLRLAGLVLLERDEGVSTASLHEVELFEAVITLVPQLSYLARMDRPLHRILEAVLRTGGVTRLRYAEARDAISFLADRYPPFMAVETDVRAAPWRAPHPIVQQFDDSLTALTQWVEDARTSASVSEGVSAEATVHAVECSDAIYDEAAGRCLMFCNGQVLQGSAITLVTLLAAQQPLTRELLARVLAELFGEPEDGDLDASVDAVLGELRSYGLLRETANAQGDEP